MSNYTTTDNVSEVINDPTNDTTTPTTISKTFTTDTVRRISMWKNIFLSKIVLVSIINAFTLIAVAGNRHLRKRTFFLVINLTFTDLLGGVVSRPLLTFVDLKAENMAYSIILHVVETLFLSASLISLSLISLDRLHATLHPFRHCLIEKHVYFKVIACSWVIALLMASLTVLKDSSVKCVAFSYTFITLIIITVSYICLLYTSPSPRDLSTSRMPSSA